MDKLPVIFRTERKDRRGGLVAVFPTIPATYDGYNMMCYAHVGQHGSVSMDWYNQSVKPTSWEVQDLLLELRRIYEQCNDPVKLVVYKKMTPLHREAFSKEANRISNL